MVTRIRSSVPGVAQGISFFYGEHRIEDGFADFHVSVGVRRRWKPKAVFEVDGVPPFHPLPGDQALPMLEWGLNWCVSSYCHQYLILHAAVIERGGHAVLLPAPPGSGKSTLCAGLVASGWRLLSDELCLIDPATLEILPLARPISLKNASIDVIGRFAPELRIGPRVRDTVKGTVAHLKPPSESVHRQAERARPRWVVMPRYVQGAPAALEPLSKGRAFMQLAESAFNYELHGAQGFEHLCRIIRSSACYSFSYGDLGDAVRIFDRLSG